MIASFTNLFLDIVSPIGAVAAIAAAAFAYGIKVKLEGGRYGK